ncbi:MAG: KH domain-containing protein [Vicinamibacteria bacterium]|nr:KH domain-containing protein [Vicinamibacteria bacterium]
MRQLVTEIVRGLVSEPGRVSVDESRDRDVVYLEVSVAASDRGRVIGRHGATADALRTLLDAVGHEKGVAVELEILD